MENSFAAKSTPDSEEETTEQFLDFDHTYAQFRADHPVRQIHLKGHKWEYIDTGTGDVLILLPGFFGVAGTDFMYILGLKNFFHIISITYPETIYSIADDLIDNVPLLVSQSTNALVHEQMR